MTRFLFRLLFAAIGLLLTGAALAQEEDPTVLMARQRFKEGIEFFDARQYSKARAAFLQAYALKKHPAVLLNLAQSELRSGHEASAANHFSQFLREASDAKPEERQAALAGLADAKKAVGEVTIRVDETGAELSAGSEILGKAPLPGPVYLAPGTHVLTAKKGDLENSVEISLGAGESKAARLAIKRTTPRASSTPASPPVARVAERRDQTGSDGLGGWFSEHPIAWVTSAVAVVGFGAGVGLVVASQSNYNNADSTAAIIEAQAEKDDQPSRGICTRIGDIATQRGPARANDYQNACSIYQKYVDRGDALKTGSIVAFVVGGAALLGTGAYYVLDSGSREHTARNETPPSLAEVAITPLWAPGVGGITIRGSF